MQTVVPKRNNRVDILNTLDFHYRSFESGPRGSQTVENQVKSSGYNDE